MTIEAPPRPTTAPPPQVTRTSVTRTNVTRTSMVVSSFLAAAGIFAAINFATTKFAPVHSRTLNTAVNADLQTASLMGKPQSWWATKEYLTRATTPDIMLLGSSQMMCFTSTDAAIADKDIDLLLNHDCVILIRELQQRGVPAAAAEGSAPVEGTAPASEAVSDVSQRESESVPSEPTGKAYTVFNAATCGAMISDDYLTEHGLMQSGRVPHVVVLGISPRDFIDGQLPAVSFTEPFHFYTPVTGAAQFDGSSFIDVFDRLNWQWFNELAVRKIKNDFDDACSSVGTVIGIKPSNIITKDLVPFNVRIHSQFSLRPGLLSASRKPFNGFMDNHKEYSERYKSPRMDLFRRQSGYLNRLLTDLDQRGVKTVLVGLPLDYDNRIMLTDPFWQTYRKEVGTIAQAHNVEFHDLSWSKDFDRRDFTDGVHLNWWGAQKLASRIADVIQHDGLLPR